ncbi:MAG TPA: radical SAM protein [Methanospirillum sp.]|nr:radical SAM protein [Methanospirillum sp.]
MYSDYCKERCIIRELTARTKAELLSIGHAQVDPALQTPEYVGSSTAGPGAGGRSVFFSAGGRRVRLSIRPESPLHISAQDEEVVIEKDGVIIAEGELERIGSHCPNQAYITVSEQCCFHCAFCPVHTLKGPVKSRERVLSIIDQVYLTGDLRAISLTGGVEKSPDLELDRMTRLVEEVVREYDVPVGVSVYPTDKSSDELYAAGADEVKYNVETMDPAIFPRVCPDLSLDQVIRELTYAGDLFGKDHVSSNMIIGLGETDETVLAGVTQLAGIGVIPVLRAIAIHPSLPLPGAVRPSAERIFSLAAATKEILGKNGLSPLHARTMCLPCTGCDLIPDHDL